MKFDDAAMPTPLNIRFFALTDIGLKRKKNEDAYAIYQAHRKEQYQNETDFMFIVADGIGGHACGDLASEMACRGLKDFFYDQGINGSSGSYVQRIEKLIRSADTQIREKASNDPACLHMGTTLSTLVISREFCLTAHVGDSRIYRLRNSHFSQLTTDHTFVQEMIDEGELTPSRAVNHPLRNMLTHAVGTQEPLEKVEIAVSDIAAGDRFLISSDGLHDLVDQNTIADALENQPDPDLTAKLLLQTALDNGGKDNITIVVIYI